MGVGQEPRLEPFLPAGDGMLEVEGADQPVLGDSQGQLHHPHLHRPRDEGRRLPFIFVVLSSVSFIGCSYAAFGFGYYGSCFCTLRLLATQWSTITISALMGTLKDKPQCSMQSRSISASFSAFSFFEYASNWS